MFSFNLVRWLKRWTRPRVTTIQKKPRVRLNLEELESRLAPASVWTGAGGTAFWSNAGNWTGPAPTSGATVDLLFPNSASTFASTNDVPNVFINSLQIGSGSTYTFAASPGISSTLGNPATNSGT